MAQRLRFYCRGTAQVTDPHAADRGTRRCIGRRWQEVTPGRWSWVPSGEPQEVDYHHDLAKAARDGDLWCADEATAKYLGLPFDPTFGGEGTQSIKDFKAKLAGDAPEPPKDAGKTAGRKGDS